MVSDRRSPLITRDKPLAARHAENWQAYTNHEAPDVSRGGTR
jgi:hypothetical protein